MLLSEIAKIPQACILRHFNTSLFIVLTESKNAVVADLHSEMLEKVKSFVNAFFAPINIALSIPDKVDECFRFGVDAKINRAKQPLLLDSRNSAPVHQPT